MRAMSVPSPTPIRRLVSGTGGVLRIVALLVGALVIAVYGLGNRSVDPTAPPSIPPAAIVGAATASALEPSTAPPEPTATPTVEPSDAATPTAIEPTPEPTPNATPKPTPKPAPKPTPRPTHDPAPEGTPRVTTASGSFGQTLTVLGVTARVARTAAQAGALSCVTDDPERQGWTEVVSYELVMTWPDAGDAEEPWVAVGSKPWNVLDFDGPSPFKSGSHYVVSTCHRPSDSDKVKVEISPPGSPLIYYRWYFD